MSLGSGGAERRRFQRMSARLSLRLEADHAPGGAPMEETAVAENVSLRGAQVMARTLPVLKGAILSVAEVGGDWKRV